MRRRFYNPTCFAEFASGHVLLRFEYSYVRMCGMPRDVLQLYIKKLGNKLAALFMVVDVKALRDAIVMFFT